MENEFVTYEIAKLLKELNFDEPCLAWYYFNEENSSYALNSFKQDYGDKFDWWKYSELDSDVYVDHLMAPFWQQVINWLREEYKLIVSINIMSDLSYYSLLINIDEDKLNLSNQSQNRGFITYEEALEDGLFEALKLIKSA